MPSKRSSTPKKNLLPEWKDETSYSQAEARGPEKKVPRIWKMQVGKVDITVHRHIHYPGAWLLSSNYLKLECFELEEKGESKAKKSSLVAIRHALKVRRGEIEEAIDGLFDIIYDKARP